MGADKHTTPLKVLMTADTVGGVWTYAMDLCRAMAAHTVQYHLVTLGAKMQPWQRQEVAQLPQVTVYETEYRLEWMQEPWDDIDESARYLLALRDEILPDLVHLNGYAYGNLNWQVPVLMVAHSDVYSWWRGVHQENPPADWAEYYNRVRAGLQAADHIVAPSAAMLSEIRDIYAPGSKQSVIYNARTADLFYCAQKERTVLSIGRVWDEAKNIPLLIDTAPHINCPVKMAGDNNFDGNTIDTVSSNITYLGKLNTQEIAAELSRAGIYCLPARYEPFGLSVLEAALSGCALVLSNIPSLREIWKDNALYADPSNPQEWATTINSLLENPERLQEMAAKARHHAQQFSTAQMATQYRQLYQQLLQHHYSTSAIETL